MDLLALVDRLEELVGNAQKMPIGSRAIVDRRRLLDVVDQMRIAIPQEVREAQQMVAERDARRRETEEEARLVVARAEDRAARMVEQHELTLAARRRAEEVATEAERRLELRIDQANADIEMRIGESRRLASQQMDAADEYAQELLARLDRQLQAFVGSVQSGIAQLEKTGRVAAAERADEEERERLLRESDPQPIAAGPVLLRREEPPREELRQEPRSDDRTPDQPHQEQPVRQPVRAEELPRAAVPERTPRLDAAPTVEAFTAPQRAREDDGLPNLLRRRPAQTPLGRNDDAPAMIDDFELPELDDEPTRLREDDQRR
jgi:hypothetical protein